MKSERKVQGAQWYITLPKDWRRGHDIKKGDIMIATFEEDSVMILNPQNRRLSARATCLEDKLIKLLTRLPGITDNRELVKSLREIVDDLDTA